MEGEAEAPSEGLEGIWTDMAMGEKYDKGWVKRERRGKDKVIIDAKSTRVETQAELNSKGWKLVGDG